MLKTMDNVRQFMDREQLAAFTTVNSKDEPCVVPVFFTYHEEKVYVQADRNSVKVRNLLKKNHVAITVYREEEAVIIRGTARVVDDEEFIQRTQEHIHKYDLRLDKQGRDALGIPLFDKKVRCVIEVTPTRILFW